MRKYVLDWVFAVFCLLKTETANKLVPRGALTGFPKYVSCPFAAFTAFAQFGLALNLTEDFSVTTRQVNIPICVQSRYYCLKLTLFQ